MPPINATTWSWDQRTDVPQQSNCIDCGVFSLLFALFSAIKRDFDFTQSDIPYFRRKIVQDLLSGLELFFAYLYYYFQMLPQKLLLAWVCFVQAYDNKYYLYTLASCLEEEDNDLGYFDPQYKKS